MIDRQKQIFFDRLAERWDTMIDGGLIREQLRNFLQTQQIRPDEIIVDVGCGTGNLTQVLLHLLGENGRVIALDLSAAMIAKARAKNPDARVEWRAADITAIPLPDQSVDRIICFSAWPHFSNPTGVIHNIRRMLRPGGLVYVWHVNSRVEINRIHAQADPSVSRDVLIAVEELGRCFSKSDFQLEVCQEDDEHYLLIARKDAQPK